ncbi:unnamed protein product, partial [Rotaria sp. Silwood1]
SITGDFLFNENTNPIPSNRTVNHDSLSSMYCQSSVGINDISLGF